MALNKISKIIKSILLGYLIVTLVSCDKEGISPVTINDILVEIGTEWQYNQEWRIQQYEPGSNGDLFNDTTLTGSIITRVVKDTVLNDTQTVWVFENKNTIGTGGLFGSSALSESYTYNYMYKDNEGLKMYAYRFSNQLLYPQSLRIKSYGISQEKIASDDIIMESNPLVYIQLPLVENSVWTYKKSNNFQGQINKKVTGYEFLKVGSENYFCYKVEWEYLLNDAFAGLKTIEWFSDIGMVRMEIHHERTMLTNNKGEALGEIQMTEIVMLEDHQKN